MSAFDEDLFLKCMLCSSIFPVAVQLGWFLAVHNVKGTG